MKQQKTISGKANITYIDTRNVAKLADLVVTEEEHLEIQNQLNDIIGYIKKLNSVDTSDIEPTAQVTGLKNVTRNDNFADDRLSVTDALSGTKKTHNGLFKVDKLVDTTS